MGSADGTGGMTAREGFALREHSFIDQTENQLDSFIAQGREVWQNLTEQRDILKGTQRKLRDVGVTLGLSRNVIVRAGTKARGYRSPRRGYVLSLFLFFSLGLH